MFKSMFASFDPFFRRFSFFLLRKPSEAPHGSSRCKFNPNDLTDFYPSLVTQQWHHLRGCWGLRIITMHFLFNFGGCLSLGLQYHIKKEKHCKPPTLPHLVPIMQQFACLNQLKSALIPTYCRLNPTCFVISFGSTCLLVKSNRFHQFCWWNQFFPAVLKWNHHPQQPISDQMSWASAARKSSAPPAARRCRCPPQRRPSGSDPWWRSRNMCLDLGTASSVGLKITLW